MWLNLRRQCGTTTRKLGSVLTYILLYLRAAYVPTILTGVIVGLFAMNMDIGQAAELTNIGTLAAFALVCAGVIVLRKIEPHRMRPFKCPAVPLVPILGIVSCLALMLGLPVITWTRFAVWMLLGLIVFFLYSNRSERTNVINLQDSNQEQ